MINQYKARIEEVNGEKRLIIEPIIEEIIKEDGSIDIIVHAPSLSLIDNFIRENLNG